MIIKLDMIIKNKNKVLNFGVILLLLFIAFQIYRAANKQEGTLSVAKENELKKNKVIQNIGSLEKAIEGYKKVFVKQDLGSIMDTMSALAKTSSIEILSLKPINEESYPDYVKFLFSLTAKAPNYHSLADFISKIENYKDIYFVDEVVVTLPQSVSAGEGESIDLKVNLRISTVSYL